MDKLKSCKLATRLASDALDRDLSLFERLRLRLHLSMCRACTDCKQEMLLLHQTLTRLQEKEAEASASSLSDEDRKSILNALQKIDSA